MQESTKDKIIFLLVGIIIGIIGTAAGGVYVYKSLRGYQPAPRVASSKPSKASVKVPKRSDFKLSFEVAEDAKVLQAAKSTTSQIVKEHATDGSRSLKVVLEAGGSYPGVSWEVYGRDVQNWKGAEAFVMDIYNASDRRLPVEIKFKSGAKYPKKTFTRHAYLEPKQSNNIRIPMEQLGKVCDITKMSYFKLFTKSPQSNIPLYFDKIGTY